MTVPAAANSRVGVITGTISTATCGMPSASAMSGADSTFGCHTMTSGRNSRAACAAFTMTPRMTGRTTSRRFRMAASGDTPCDSIIAEKSTPRLRTSSPSRSTPERSGRARRTS